jgi:autotransporter-associated beta strand protein
LIAVLPGLLSLAPAANAGDYTFTSFGTPFRGINDAGQTVGNTNNFPGSSFLYSGGNYTPVNVPGAAQGTYAFGINNAGQIVGGSEVNWVSKGFVYSNGAYVSFNVPGDNGETTPFGINNASQIVGFFNSGNYHGFLYDNGVYTQLDAPGATQGTSAYGINDHGQIVGGVNGGPQGWLYSGGVYTTVSVPGASGTRPFGINNAGQIVGLYDDGNGGEFGFVRSGDTYTTIAVPGATNTQALGINNNGQIVGQYSDGSGVYGFLANPLLDLGGFDLSIGSLAGAGTVTNSGIASPATLTAGSDNVSTTYVGVIQDGFSATALTKVGTGTLTLSGANTYTGATTINGGTLAARAVNVFSSSSAITVASGTKLDLAGFNQTIGSLSGMGFVTLGSGALTTGADNTSTTFSGTISDTGALIKIGTGTFALSNTNAYTGGTTINAGTLQLGNGGTSGSITGNVTDHGKLAFDRSDALTFGGAISGSGAVQQNGTGTTTLSGANTYTGSTTVNAGTLAIAANGSIWSNVTNNATFKNEGTVIGGLANNESASNTGTITGRLTNGGAFAQTGGIINGGLTNTGTVNAQGGAINGPIANNTGIFTVLGDVTGTGTVANATGATLAVSDTGNFTLGGLLANSGAITVAPGGFLTANAGIINGVGGTLTNNGTVIDDLINAAFVVNNGTYKANVASNTGIVINRAGANWIGTINTAGVFDNEGTINGSLTQTAGTVINNGTIAGAVTVSGGTFTGSGSVGALTIANGTTFAPGSGIAGTSETVNGDLVFQPGATYLVGLNPATASIAAVTGTATLGGATVNAFFANGSYITKQYTILSAGGGVSGTFAPNTVNTNLPANFHTTLSYDANDAYLNLVLNFAIPGGLTGNQQAVGNSLTNFFNANGSISMIYGALSAAALTRASGENATGSQQATFVAMSQFMGLLTDPFLGRGNGINGSSSAIGYADERDQASSYTASRRTADAFAMFTIVQPAPFVPRWSVWASAYGGAQSTSGSASSARTTLRAASLARWSGPITCSHRTRSPASRSRAAERISMLRTILALVARTCFRPGPSSATMRARPISQARWPMAGRTSPPTAQ